MGELQIYIPRAGCLTPLIVVPHIYAAWLPNSNYSPATGFRLSVSTAAATCNPTHGMTQESRQTNLSNH
ncbi:hypothetical protein ACLOJK_013981 [Asimina triloba]